VLYRKLLKEALDAVAEGRDPMNVFRDPAIERIDLAVETRFLGRQRTGGINRTGLRIGNTTKYSPILNELAASKENMS
jgi:hypothetical protein